MLLKCFIVIVPNAPTTMGITTSYFACLNLANSSLNRLVFLNLFSFFITYSYVSWYCRVYNHCIFLYLINYHNIQSFGLYHVIIQFEEIPQNFQIFVLNYTFRFMFIPKSCPIECQLLTQLPIYILSYSIMSLFVLLLGKFATFTHYYLRYSLISSTTHATKG